MITLKDNFNSENECIQPYMFKPSRENEPRGLSGSGTHQMINLLMRNLRLQMLGADHLYNGAKA